MAVSPALQRLRQKDLGFGANLGYIIRHYLKEKIRIIIGYIQTIRHL
jgi:hypothetical protein